MCQRSQCVGCCGHPDGIVLTSCTLLPFLSVDENTHRMMLDCMHNRIPVTERTTTSNKTTTITCMVDEWKRTFIETNNTIH